jgi:hypothetical protein
MTAGDSTAGCGRRRGSPSLFQALLSKSCFVRRPIMSAKSDDNQAGVNRIENAMPSLQLLEGSLRSKRDLGKLFGVHVQPGDRGREIADGYVRLVEKALLEYQESRATLIAFLADGTAEHQHRAQDHFESCIQSLHRAILYLERLRRLGYRRADGASFIPRPRARSVAR